jgi:two-component system response regulator AtoC
MKVLILDDEPNMRASLTEFLSLEGIDAISSGDAQSAREILGKESVDACVVDLKLPGESGLDFLSWLKQGGPDVPAIMISAHGGVKDAVQALKLGAFDYLEKPFDPEELCHRIKKAHEERRMSALVELGRKTKREAAGWVGESEAMLSLMRLVMKVAPTTSTVLITGESGTGKEVSARAIHAASQRADGPFVAVNVGALPEQLLESELFGYEKGAFTGADGRKAGIFELAMGGTLFLDEIGEMPIHLQVKLLRAIQEKCITRLGGTRPIPVDVRIIAATNRRLEDELAAGRFREDLYYRLNVIRLEIPPLRSRKSDIPLLAGHFIGRISSELGKKIDGMTSQAMGRLMAYDFPGNVRELENAIERAVILADASLLGEADFSFFPAARRESPAPSAPEAPRPGKPHGEKPESMREVERRAVVEAMRRQGGHREKSAADLGFTRRTLLNKIKEYRIEQSEWEA